MLDLNLNETTGCLSSWCLSPGGDYSDFDEDQYLEIQCLREPNLDSFPSHGVVLRGEISLLHITRGTVACILAAVMALISFAEPVVAEPQKTKELYRALDLYHDVLKRVRSDYFKEPDDEKLIRWTIDGILQSLDPHSTYLSPEDLKNLQVQSGDSFAGLGLEVTMERDALKVIAPIYGTPSQKAGVLAGDQITHIDGRSIAGLSLTKAVERMRGKPGEPIKLRIARKGHTSPINLTVVREVIKTNPVKAQTQNDVGYIKIVTFGEHTTKELILHIERLKAEIGPSLKGFVLDLRNNPGGLLDQAIGVSDAFLETGTIVITKGRNDDETQRSQAKKGDVAGGAKIVVLIDRGSAAASEIVAGALQDHKRAIIVGTRSYGKGTVQTIIPLGKAGALILTTARYYTPANRSIQARGIDPDIVVKREFSDEVHSDSDVASKTQKDTQLQYALGLLRGEIQKSQ